MITWISEESSGSNELIISVLHKSNVVLYHVQRYPFAVHPLKSIPLSSIAEKIQLLRYDETNLMLLLYYSNSVELLWFQDGKDDVVTNLINQGENLVLAFLPKYQQLLAFNNFSVLAFEKLEPSAQSAIGNKKVPLITELGNFSNLMDSEYEKIISVHCSQNDSILIISSCKFPFRIFSWLLILLIFVASVSSLPILYWADWDQSQIKIKIFWKETFFFHNLKVIMISSEKTDISDMAIVKDGNHLIVVNKDGIVKQLNSLDLESLVNVELWEVKNNIITLFATTSSLEYYMIQIEELLNYNIQIIAKFSMLNFSNNLSLLNSQANNFSYLSLQTSQIILSSYPSLNQKSVIFLSIHEVKGIEAFANDSAIDEYGLQEIGLQLNQIITPVLENGNGKELIYSGICRYFLSFWTIFLNLLLILCRKLFCVRTIVEQKFDHYEK
jgi:hypothetical protein